MTVAVEVRPVSVNPGGKDHILLLQVLLDQRAVVVGTDPGMEGGVEAEPGQAHGDIQR